MTTGNSVSDIDMGRALRQTGLLTAGLMTVLVLAGSVVQIGGAVVAPGDVATLSKSAQITHPTGGVLARLMVHEGQRVARGQPLLILEDDVSSVGARGTGEDLDSMTVRRSRLEAERDGAAGFVTPKEMNGRSDASAASATDREKRQFSLNRASDAGQKSQLLERIHQSQKEIESLRIQMAAATRQRQIIEPEREGMRKMWDKRLISLNRLNEMERTAVDLEANAAALSARIAQSNARIAELRQNLIQIDDDRRARAGTELAELATRIGDARTRATSAADAQKRTVIRAPSEGVVDSIPYQTTGSFLPAGQPLVRVTPDHDRQIVEVRIAPSDVDQVKDGQRASIRFSALNAQTTPQVDGVVEWLSAERIVDEKTGTSYYAAKIRIELGDIRKLGKALRPGMPVEAYISTRTRSLLSYLTKPLSDQMGRAFREGD